MNQHTLSKFLGCVCLPCRVHLTHQQDWQGRISSLCPQTQTQGGVTAQTENHLVWHAAQKAATISLWIANGHRCEAVAACAPSHCHHRAFQTIGDSEA